MTCSITGCADPVGRAHGLCVKHLSRFYRHGTTDDPEPRPAPIDRIKARVREENSGYGPPCWIFTGNITPAGYGRTKIPGGRVLVHRYMWEQLRGPIEPGMEIDHLCRNRACCNPDHLEPVTHMENQHRGFSPWGINSRKTHCARGGHELAGANLYVTPRGERMCIACRREAQARYRARKKAA